MTGSFPDVLRDARVAGLEREVEMLRAAIAAQAAAYEDQPPADPVEELRREVGLLREENHKLIGDLATAESDRDTAQSQRDYYRKALYSLNTEIGRALDEVGLTR